MRLLPVIAICVMISSSAFAARIIPDKDITYRGAFRVAVDRNDSSGRWFGGTSGFMTFNPYGNGGAGSIIAMGQEDSNSYVGEMTIPSNPGTGNIASMPQATGLQSFTDVRGSFGAIQTGDTRQQTYGLAVLGPHGDQTQPHLYWMSVYNYQPNNATANTALGVGWSSLDFSQLNEAGQWNLSGYLPANYAWYAMAVDATWADTYASGRYLGVGRDRINNSTEGFGPSLYLTAPWASGNPPATGTQLAATKLLGYPITNPALTNYSHGDGSRGGAWVVSGDKSALIFGYNKGMRSAVDTPSGAPYPYEDYKTGEHIGIPSTEISNYMPTSTDYKSGPWVGTLLFYDTSELAQVSQGTRTPDDVKPYAVWSVDKFLKGVHGAIPSRELKIGGVAYNPTAQDLYVQELFIDGSYPIIHVFHITSSESTSVPSQPPTVPGNVQQSGASVSWSPSTKYDSTTDGIVYVIFKHCDAFVSLITNRLGCDHVNGVFDEQSFTCTVPAMWRPIASTTSTAWTDTAYVDGNEYTVVAHDDYMSPSHVLNNGEAFTPGSCGPSNGIALSSAPTAELCTAGTPSAVSGTGPWSWTCAGSGGGSTANCGATLATQARTVSIKLGSGGKMTGILR